MRAPELKLADKLEEIKNEVEESTAKKDILDRIEKTQNQLRSIVVNNQYPETDSTKSAAQNVEEQNQLLSGIDKDIDKEIEKDIEWKTLEKLDLCNSLVKRSEKLREWHKEICRMERLANELCEWSDRDQALQVRLNAIHNMLDLLIEDMKDLQDKSGACATDYALREYKNQMMQEKMDSIVPIMQLGEIEQRNKQRFTALVQRIDELADSCMQAASSLRTDKASASASPAASTSTAPRAALFGSSSPAFHSSVAENDAANDANGDASQKPASR